MSEFINTGVNTAEAAPTSEPAQQPIESTEIQSQAEPSQVQAEQINPDGVDENSRQGFIAALQAERDKARIEAQKAEFYRQQYEERIRQQSIAPQQPQNNQPPVPDFDPEEIPDMRTVQKYVEAQTQAIREQYETQQKQARIESMAAAARSQYPDFDEVLAKTREVVMLDPGFAAAIQNASNPAEMAYRIGRMHPDYQLRQEKQIQGQATLSAIQQNAQKPATLSQIKDSGSVQAQAGFYKSMPSDEWRSRVESTKSRA